MERKGKRNGFCAEMDNVIQLMNKIQKACTLLGDVGDDHSLPTLLDALPTIVVLGGQSSGKSSVLENIVGCDFLPRGSGIMTRRPLVLQLCKTDAGQEDYAQFLHTGHKKFTDFFCMGYLWDDYAQFLHTGHKKSTDFSMVQKEIQAETDRVIGNTKRISSLPINLSIYSPHVVNLTLVDLPGLTNVAVEGQPESIVQEIEDMVRSYVKKPNCILLAITPANQDLATSDAIKIAREVDPAGERTVGVLTKLDLMDKGTNALDVLEGSSYRLRHPWVGVVNRSQADINRNVDMIAARRREREFFATSQDYRHLASRMGSEYLAKLLSKHLESDIKTRIPKIMSLINKNVDGLESELANLGSPVAVDSQAQLYTILELCRAFDRVFKEHLDGGRPGGDKIYGIFDHQLPVAMKKLPLDRYLSLQNVKKVVSESDGYQPHLIAPEQGYRRLIDGAIHYFRGPAQATVDAVHFILKELVRKTLGEAEELRRFPSLRAEIASVANNALERFREESKKTALRMVDMESAYLTVDFLRTLPHEAKNDGNPYASVTADRYTETHFKRIGSNVMAYVITVSELLRNTIPKVVVHCQVREANQSLLDHFYVQLGNKEGYQLAELLGEDPFLIEKRRHCSKKLELYKSARDEIDSVLWSR